MKTKYRYLVIPLVVSITHFAACSNQDLDLGGDGNASRDGGSDSATSETNGGSADEASTPSGGEAEGDDETWSGYIETYSFPSGSSSLLLTFTRQPGGGVTGHARFGSAPLYSPPTDPHVGYPDLLSGGETEPSSLEGFRYTLRAGTLNGTRVRATIDDDELYAAWCALQTPVKRDTTSDGTPGYWCLPTSDPDTSYPPSCFPPLDGGEPLDSGLYAPPIDCGWYILCNSSYCDCTAAGCTDSADLDSTFFDFQIQETSATGSVQIYRAGPYNIHLTKQ